jgi:hypothetical protein
MRRARDPITRLQRAIECLPDTTRRAMLDGIRSQPIVAGAYTDGRGGICPMLAAHRRGGRVSFLSFARAWDAFARAQRPRRATARELRTLEDLLVASLEHSSDGELGRAIADHRRLWYRRREFDATPLPADQALAPIESTSRSRWSGENGLVKKRSAPAS